LTANTHFINVLITDGSGGESVVKIAVIGAGGSAGERIVAEAVARGHLVTAIGPTASKLPNGSGIVAHQASTESRDELAKAFSGHDSVVSAVRFVRYKPEELLAPLRDANVLRLIIVGGAGSLRSPAGGLVIDSPNFPAAAKDEAKAGVALLEHLRSESSIDWTFISPAASFAPGERLGRYRSGIDELVVDASGNSRISMEDYAIALMDEVENPRHPRSRFSVGY
jgi:putative NADH-flavin reductase